MKILDPEDCFPNYLQRPEEFQHFFILEHMNLLYATVRIIFVFLKAYFKV